MIIGVGGQFSKARRLGLCALALFGCAEGKKGSTKAPGEPRGAAASQADSVVVSYYFDPSPGEELRTERAVRQLAAKFLIRPVNRPVEVYRFPSKQRYLIVAVRAKATSSDSAWGISYLILDPAEAVATQPAFSLKDAEFNAVESVRDAGNPSVTYCFGYEGETEPPLRMRADLVGAAWRFSAGTPKTCDGTRPPVNTARILHLGPP